MTDAPALVATPSPPTTRAGLVVTAEVLAYAGLMVVSALLRLFDLAWMPLDQAEAALALPAWRAAQGLPLEAVAGAPLLFQVQQLAFWLLHGGEAVARLGPALAGIALIGAAWGLRPAFGRPAALAVAALFAFSPLWLFYGRNVSPASLSALWVVLLIGLVIRGGRIGRTWAPVAAGLLVVSGGLAFSAALAAGLGLLALRWRGEHVAVMAQVSALWPEPADRRRGALVLGLTIVLAATGLFLRPEGFAALIQLPAVYAEQFAGGLGLTQGLLLPLVVYAPVTLVFGLAGLVAAWNLPSPLGRILAAWTLVGALSAALAGPGTLADLILPLSLAAGLGLGRLWQSVSEAFQWREEGVMTLILLVVAAYSLLTAFSAVSDAQGAEEARLRLIGGVAVMGVLILVYLVLWGTSTTGRVLGLTWLVLGGLLAFSSAANLNYRASLVVAEPLRPTYVTPDAARLAADLAAASQARYRDPEALAAVVDPDLAPALAWLLRSRRDLRWGQASGQLTEEAVVTPLMGSGEEAPAFGPAAYLGRRYLVTASFSPRFLAPGATDPWLFLRWLLRREPEKSPTVGGRDLIWESVSLYLKVDDEVNP